MTERERERQIQQLRTEIQQLELIANRTAQQEAELQAKKDELERLERQNTQQPTNWTPWIIGGVVLVIVIGIVIYLLTRNKEKNHGKETN